MIQLTAALLLASAVAAHPELVVQTGHAWGADLLLTDPDGTLLLSTSYNSNVHLWDMRSGKLMRVIPAKATTASFSADGRLLLTGLSADRTVVHSTQLLLWETATGKLLKILPIDGAEMQGVGLSPSGDLVAMARELEGDDFEVITWDLKTGKQLARFTGKKDHYDYISPVFLGASTVYLSGSTLAAFDARTGKSLPVPAVRSSGATADGQGGLLIAEGSTTKADVVALDAKGVETERYSLPPFGDSRRIMSVRRLNDGTLTALDREGPSREYTVYQWDPKARQRSGYTLRGRTNGACVSTRTNTLITSPISDGNLRQWAVRTGAPLGALGSDADAVYKVSFSPDGRFLAAGSGIFQAAGRVRVWDLATGRVRYLVDGFRDVVYIVKFSPDGRKLLYGGDGANGVESGLHMLDLATGEHHLVYKDEHLNSADFTPDGQQIVIASGWMNDGKFVQGCIIIDASTGAVTRKFDGSEVRITGGGRYLSVIVGWDQLKLLKLDGTPVESFRVRSHIIVSPNGEWLAYSRENKDIVLRSLKGKAKEREIPVHSPNILSFEFSPDGKQLSVVDSESHYYLYDVATLKLLRDSTEHTGNTRGLAYAATRLSATGAQDGSIILREAKTGEPVATLLALRGQDSAVFLPSGEYMATRGALSAVAFRVGARAYGFDQFDLRFNRPDLVLQAIGIATQETIRPFRRAFEKRLARAGLTEEAVNTDLVPPELTLKRDLSATTSATSLAFDVSARDASHHLERLFVTVNETPFDGMLGGVVLRSLQTKTLDRHVEVPLVPGLNRVAVSVLNDAGVESLREEFEITSTAPAAPRKLYALLVGVSEYKDSKYALRYAAKDATDLGELLNGASGFAERKIIRVLNGEVTKEKVQQAAEMLRQAGPADEVVLFLAGHGLLDDQLDYYFATNDVDFEQPAGRGLPYDSVEGLLDGVKAQRKVLLMDTCNSGEVDKEETRQAPLATSVQAIPSGGRGVKRKGPAIGLQGLSSLLGELFADVRHGSGAFVISSAGGAEYALESDAWHNGVFTFTVLDGLRSGKADRNKDRSISVSELRDYVQREVPTLTHGQQTPTVRRDNLSVDFPVY